MEDGRLTVWTGTQTPFNVRRELATAFALAEGDVRVISPPMGGSFGAKTFTRVEAMAAALARKAAVPRAHRAARDEVFVTLVRHPARFRVRLGARRDGTFVARRIWADWDTGAYADTGPNVAAKGGWAAVGPYRFDHVEVDSRCVYTNSPSAGAFRGYAATQAVWASEQCVDLLAERLGTDPLELRLQNVLRDGDRFATGETMHDFHVAMPRARRRAHRLDRQAGQGLCAVMKACRRRAGPRPASCSRGALRGREPTTDGPGARSSAAAVTASSLGCDLSVDQRLRGRQRHSPFDTRTTSSRSTHMMAGAVGRAGATSAADRRRARGQSPTTSVRRRRR